MSATIMTQQLDENNDPIESPNGPVFIQDLDAVAQIIMTTLRFLMGEWWENLTIGFPLFQDLIGSADTAQGMTAAQLIIQNAILACTYVLQITDFSYLSNSSLRSFSFTCEVSTAFGTLTVSSSPGSSATITTS
jgi:hypothetical protein